MKTSWEVGNSTSRTYRRRRELLYRLAKCHRTPADAGLWRTFPNRSDHRFLSIYPRRRAVTDLLGRAQRHLGTGRSHRRNHLRSHRRCILFHRQHPRQMHRTWWRRVATRSRTFGSMGGLHRVFRLSPRWRPTILPDHGRRPCPWRRLVTSKSVTCWRSTSSMGPSGSNQCNPTWHRRQQSTSTTAGPTVGRGFLDRIHRPPGPEGPAWRATCILC